MVLKEEQNKKGMCLYHNTQSLIEIKQDKNWIVSVFDYTGHKYECRVCGYTRIYTERDNSPIKVLL